MDRLNAIPSGANVWIACPMGLTMQNTYGRRYPSGVDAQEGTAAHEVFALHLQGAEAIPSTASNGVAVDSDMVRHAIDAAAYVRQLGANLHVEHPMTMRVQGHEVSGKEDVVVTGEDRQTVHVVEYKYGHRHVAADDARVKVYGVSAAQMFRRERVVLHVIQPRDYSAPTYRSFQFTPAMQNEFAIEAENALRLAHTRSPYAVAGSHCRDCPGRANCREVREWPMIDDAPGVDLALTPEAVASELRLAERVAELATARLKGLQDEAAHVIRSGGRVPGWALEPSVGRERITNPEAFQAIASAFGVKVTREEFITPLQAINAGLPAELVRQHTTRPRGEPKLVPSKNTLAAQAFSEK